MRKGASLVFILCQLPIFSPLITEHVATNIIDLQNYIEKESISRDSMDLDFSKNLIQNVDPKIFTEFPTLVKVRFDNNTKFQPKDENGPILFSQTLLEFSCNFCNITKIGERTFSEMPELKILSLTRNHMKRIEERAFANNTKLTDLTLDDNELEELPEKLLENLAVKSLNINNNSCYKFPEAKPFLISKSLENFMCISCNITEIYEKTFSETPNLRKIQLQNNLIHRIDERAFVGLSQLEVRVGLDIVKNLPLQLKKEFYVDQDSDPKDITTLYWKPKSTKQCRNLSDFLEEISKMSVKNSSPRNSTTSTTEQAIIEEESVNPTLLDALIAMYLVICMVLEGVLATVVSLYLAKILRSKSKEFDYSSSVLNPSDIYKIH
ncbi:insulin-like growth factor-binding protein complex acid labile subunit [Phlebotomus argentipes]|uniref:insulin-like growth factor-binding protein complex acid labile subunit n=1 Tax=Phlebotomus argentipes TaxID=94469 RepID=UPI002892D62B|nr:insulin-like growth factor-binding protein complex acid labile subunit [Phlebotomus argentipes]